jgi:hypothetical protein
MDVLPQVGRAESAAMMKLFSGQDPISSALPFADLLKQLFPSWDPQEEK